jgi:hypothetical protein
MSVEQSTPPATSIRELAIACRDAGLIVAALSDVGKTRGSRRDGGRARNRASAILAAECARRGCRARERAGRPRWSIACAWIVPGSPASPPACAPLRARPTRSGR